jgi:hypothetical protein
MVMTKLEFNELVRQTLENFVKQGKRVVSLDELKAYLLANYDIKSLNYPSVERNFLKNFIEVARIKGYIDFYDKTNYIRISQDWFDIVQEKLKSQQGDSV